jgi:hypothetical protein
MAPDAATVDVAVERYYAEREKLSAVTRIEHSLRLLKELAISTHGGLEVRLTNYPLATGAVGVNLRTGDPDSPSALFLEYYTFQGEGEPKFVLQPGEAGFDQFLGEAEKLWAGAAPALPDQSLPESLPSEGGVQDVGSSPGVTRPHS